MKIVAFALAATVMSAALAGTGHAEPLARIVIHADRPGAVIQPEIYGQFAEHLGAGIYDGVWVGEGSAIPNIHGYRKDVVEALKAIHVPVVRWPGGCFADTYHWRDGIGPRARRPVRLNEIWGRVEETNAFGTHEFMDFAELIGAKAYLAVPAGAGTSAEMNQWIEYVTSDSTSTLANERRANGRAAGWRIDYLGVGNESWGCGGSMRVEFYADLYRQFATFVRPPGDKPIVKVASGPNDEDFHWTEVLMSRAVDQLDAISLHYYTLPTGDWSHKGPANGFGEAAWASTLSHTLKMEPLIARHSAIMDRYDPKRRVALVVDEWGIWTDPAPGSNPAFLRQDNSLRDALVAALNFNIFHAHADRVRMTNISQMVNVLQALILTDKERMVLTPTYWAFDLYKGFQGATALPADLTAPDYRYGELSMPGVSASAARGADGVIRLALVNLNPSTAARVQASIVGAKARTVTGRILTAPAIDTADSFEHPDAVRPKPFAGARIVADGLEAELPPRSVVVLDLR